MARPRKQETIEKKVMDIVTRVVGIEEEV